MDFPINVDVYCSDGRYGKSTAVILDPATDRVKYVAVSDPNRLYTEYLVPVDKIDGADAEKIELNCTQAELEKMEKFSEAEFLDVPYYGGYDDFSGMPDPMANVYRKEMVPEGEVAISRGLSVEATDGFVGTVDELVINPETGAVTHLVLRTGHIWGDAEVSIPVSQVKKVDSLAVYLDRDKESIETLPVVQIRRHYSKEEINKLDIEILLWAFDAQNTAKDALDSLRAFVKEKDIDLRNAVVLVKDADGKAKAREIADVGPRRGGIMGAVVGGLIGLLAGPGGAVLGAAAGAVTGDLAAKGIDRGFSNEYLKMIESKMPPGYSALLTLVESKHSQELLDALADFNGQVYRRKMTDDVVAELSQKVATPSG